MMTDKEGFDDYAKTGVLTTWLLIDASLFRSRMDAPASHLMRLLPEVRRTYEDHYDALDRAARACDEIAAAARRFEERHWLPRLQRYYHMSDRRGHSSPLPGVRFAGWGGGEEAEARARLWGSAGRVLLTLAAILTPPATDAAGQFEARQVTLIFDETAETPRGGLQGLYATRDEALALLRAADECDLAAVMEPDPGVTLA